MAGGAYASPPTGTFIDRWDGADLRVVSYNIYFNSILSPSGRADADTPARFERFVKAVEPDVLALQEMDGDTASTVALRLDEWVPLEDGAHWQAFQRSDNVIVSRYPLLATTGEAGHVDVLVDLPDERFDSDLWLVNDHWPCCDQEPARQREADQLVGWLDRVKQRPDVPPNTPFVVLGDLNTVGSGRPLETLLSGDIARPSIDDGPLDWDGTPLTDSLPSHNAVGPNNYTWRDDSDTFTPGVLDHVVFSDSVLETVNRFVLNTMEMSEAELTATGLEPADVMVNAAEGYYDHLPLVVDFRERPVTLVGDYNRDGDIDLADYTTWRQQYGDISAPSADGNGDGVVGPADYTVWRDAFAASLETLSTTVPEPGGSLLALAAFAVSGLRRHRP